jgi:hypothetical protein
MTDLIDPVRGEIAELVGIVIANLGYPVGMGIAPNPETMTRLAEEILKMLEEQGRLRPS